MKLTETIEECIKLVIDEIEGCDTFLKEYADKDTSIAIIQSYEDDKKKWLVHLENLKYIQCETNLDSWQE